MTENAGQLHAPSSHEGEVMGYRIKLTGTSFCQETLAELIDKKVYTAALVPKPENEYDPDAMSIEIEGKHVGWVPKGWLNDAYIGWRVVWAIKNTEGIVSAWRTGGYEMKNGKTAVFSMVVEFPSARYEVEAEKAVDEYDLSGVDLPGDEYPHLPDGFHDF